MTRHNRARYQSKDRKKVTVVLTGTVYLQYVDDGAIASPQKGDLMMYPVCDPLNSTRLGEYDGLGFNGYFKAKLYDGKEWQFVSMNALFPEREHHFSKKERPIDTYYLCKEMLQARKDAAFMRTYRDHYTLDDKEDEND